MSSTPPIHVVESNDPLAVPRRVALVRPDIAARRSPREERYVMTFPHLIVREVILFQVVVIALSLAAILFDAPLEGIANPLETPEPRESPLVLPRPAGAATLFPADRRRRPAAGPRRHRARRDPVRADQPRRGAALWAGTGARGRRLGAVAGVALFTALRRLRLLADRGSDAPRRRRRCSRRAAASAAAVSGAPSRASRCRNGS